MNVHFKLSIYLVYSGERDVVKDELKELSETEAILATDTEAGDGLTVQLRLPETESGACVSDSLWQHWQREIATSPSVAVLIMRVEKFCIYIYTEFLSNYDSLPLQREARFRLYGPGEGAPNLNSVATFKCVLGPGLNPSKLSRCFITSSTEMSGDVELRSDF